VTKDTQEKMYCAQLEATLAYRDTWIRKYGIKTLIQDYNKMIETLSQRPSKQRKQSE